MPEEVPEHEEVEQVVGEETARQKMTDFIKSVIRTGVPYLTVLIVAWLKNSAIDSSALL